MRLMQLSKIVSIDGSHRYHNLYVYLFSHRCSGALKKIAVIVAHQCCDYIYLSKINKCCDYRKVYM